MIKKAVVKVAAPKKAVKKAAVVKNPVKKSVVTKKEGFDQKSSPTTKKVQVKKQAKPLRVKNKVFTAEGVRRAKLKK